MTIKPARDIVIDFGKYKGKMLGSLPSRYLKWVSKNCVRDFKEWAILADQVLVDPIYKDRIEWEFARYVLDGEGSRYRSTERPHIQLHEIGDRFGWDFLDKVGWSKVDFDLLGTSKGGRIPRLRKPSEAAATQPNLPPATTNRRRRMETRDASDPNLPPATANRLRRIERREKLNMRSRTTHEEQQPQHKDDTVSEQQPQQHRDDTVSEQQPHQHRDDTVSAADIKQVAKPFPGRQALFRKAIKYRRQS
ncbi:unnamed protein product [Lathyrus sativus]|nr:unnamed protein product [Lathyrus sativus]